VRKIAQMVQGRGGDAGPADRPNRTETFQPEEVSGAIPISRLCSSGCDGSTRSRRDNTDHKATAAAALPIGAGVSGRLASAHPVAANARKNYLHRLSNRLVGGYDRIADEALKVEGLAQGNLAKSIIGQIDDG
jgi:hypothetical protein